MKLEELKKYIAMGREIEFSYQEEQYSITYAFEGNLQVISFCQFNQACVDYHNMDELLSSAMIGETYLRDMIHLAEDVVVY